MSHGRFIVFEGLDGAGTTTQARLLAERLQKQGRTVFLAHQPSEGPVGLLIRQILAGRAATTQADGKLGMVDERVMALLFAADRLDHLDSLVLPALRSGSVVVSDRYDLSSLAYQSATAPEAHDVIPWIRELNSRAVRPDVTVVIDVPAEVAEERRRGRGGVEEMFEHRALQERLVAIYAHAETLVPGDRLVHVSGLGKAEEVSARILEAVLEAVPALRRH